MAKLSEENIEIKVNVDTSEAVGSLKHLQRVARETVKNLKVVDSGMKELPALLNQDFGFGYAINCLKNGEKVARKGWNGKGMWLKLVAEDEYSTIGVGISEYYPWIGMKTADNKFVPWLASQTDMLAEDWEVVESKLEPWYG